MKQNTLRQLKLLKLYYVFILILTIILVLPTHVSPIPSFMPLRFPHYLEMMEPFLGISWPATFEIYHLVILILAIIGSINILGIVFYPNWRLMTRISSLVGFFVTLVMVLFFLFFFMGLNPPTALIYGFYSITLLTVNILTFNAVTRR